MFMWHRFFFISFGIDLRHITGSNKYDNFISKSMLKSLFIFVDAAAAWCESVFDIFCVSACVGSVFFCIVGGR